DLASSSRFTSRSATTTSAPSRARALAKARPIPLAPPVMSATFPSSSIEGRDFRACASRFGPRSCLPMAVKTRTQAPVRAPARERLEGHVVICGTDELAFLIAEELQRLGDAVAVVAASDTGKFMQRARAVGIKTFTGDYRE